ncbi:MAG: OmpA family protein [Chitinophagaceae bacterium]|nr:OmpA family protein [Chitinophagaceae bacterium]
MKKILLVFLTLGLFATSFGQGEYKKRPSLGIHFFMNDFSTAANLRTAGLASVLKSKEWHKTKNMTAGIAVSYIQGLNNNLDFAGTLSGSFVNYPISGKPLRANSSLLLEGAATVNLKLFTDKYFFVPFITAGVGGSKYRGYYGAFMPLGVGAQVRLIDEVYLLLNSQYRIPITENASYHFYHSVGVAANLTKKKEPVPVVVPIPVVEPPKDRDGDGVLDSLDRCPDVKGLAGLQGCPDRDGDGIADIDDKCPDVKGLARYQGCPIPDTDKDGINDEEDKCPTVFGVARYQGCPVPDTDGDGVNDEEDKCINEKGPASNYGCPVIDTKIIERINKAAQNVFFSTGSSKLLAKSFPKLNDVVTILKENLTYKVNIDGHTDNTGKADKNQTLSESRAASVKAYLVSKGIDESRLTSTGYGQDKPIADNKTAAGRGKNRRVEMTVRNY